LSTQSQTIPSAGITPILKHGPEELSILNESPNHQFINYTQISPTSTRPPPQKRKSKGALDFILNTSFSSSETNQKRSRLDDENDE
ncbi:12684_t:CDS:1, partial [Racocetra persica]